MKVLLLLHKRRHRWVGPCSLNDLSKCWNRMQIRDKKEFDFGWLLIVYDAFKALTIDNMKAFLSTNITNFMVAPDCTSKWYPLGVSIN